MPHAPELFSIPVPGYTELAAGWIGMIPPKTSHHSKRIVRMGKFSRLADSPELKTARSIWFAALQPFAPPAPLEGPLHLSLVFTWPWRKSDRPKGAVRIPYPSRPDCDNLAKTVADTMAALCFFRDDAQIVHLTVSKYLGEKPGLDFSIGRLSE